LIRYSKYKRFRRKKQKDIVRMEVAAQRRKMGL